MGSRKEIFFRYLSFQYLFNKHLGLKEKKILIINSLLICHIHFLLRNRDDLKEYMPFEKIESEIQKYLKDVQEKDKEEDLLYGSENSGNEVPDDLRTHSKRMKRFMAAKERLEAEQKKIKCQKKEDKISQREEDEKQSGKKKRGRKPKKPEKDPDDHSLANVMDPDSSLMKSGPGCIQGYNGQIIVNQDGYILVPFLSNSPVDYGLPQPTYEKLIEIFELTGISLEYLKLLTDAGYWSYENYLYMKKQKIGFLCSTCHEPDVFNIWGIERNLFDLDNIADLISNFHAISPTLASIGDWCMKNLLSDDIPSTPLPLQRG